MTGASREAGLISLMRGIATHPAARGLLDDAAVLPIGGEQLVITHDAMVEGVHFRAGSDWADVAFKLMAVNLSDLAAKGAKPLGALLSMPLLDTPDDDARFVEGLAEASLRFSCPILGGDTVSLPALPPPNPPLSTPHPPPVCQPRSFAMTALGRASCPVVPARGGALAGDDLWITGPVGDAGAWLETENAAFFEAHARPEPLLEQGQALAPVVHAMMDVSDGLLIDAARMASASGLKAAVFLDNVALTAPYCTFIGDDLAALMKAVTAGDDYQLLFALPAGATPPVAAQRIGSFSQGSGLEAFFNGHTVALPERLGWQHG